MPTPLALSVIIVNFNTFALTCDCLRTLYATTQEDGDAFRMEVILVDNASRECDADLFREEFPQIRLIKNAENVGFGIANNQGMAAATGEYILLLNSDTIILPFAIRRSLLHLHARRQNPATARIALLGCEILNADGSHQASFWRGLADYRAGDAWRMGAQYNLWYTKIRDFFARRRAAAAAPVEPLPTQADSANPYLVEGLYGAFVLMQRSVWEQTGGFDPDFFLYCEETDWFRTRIRPHFDIEYFPDLQITHLGGQSGKHLSDVSRQGLASYFLYWYKRGALLYWVFIFSTYFSVFSNLLLMPFASAYGRKRLWSLLVLLPLAFWGIPRYSRRFASRPRFLKL